MKNKLQALIAEQKTLTAKSEELLSKPDIHKKKGTLDYRKLRAVFDTLMETYTTEELIEYAEMITQEQSVNPKKVYIKGHSTRGAEVIKMLEDLGGVNNKDHNGKLSEWVYLIIDGNIWASTFSPEDYTQRGYTELHLPEEVNEVDPPTEEVKFIEGEVYNVYGNIAIFKKQESYTLHTISIYRKDGTLCTDETNGYGIYTKAEWITATTEQRKQLFDALEKAGKYFDKENMRLLDVEEFALNKYDRCLMRDYDTDMWAIRIWGDGSYVAKQVIPYCDFNTIDLIGTTDSPDKHYKFVEK